MCKVIVAVFVSIAEYAENTEVWKNGRWKIEGWKGGRMEGWKGVFGI